MLRALRQLPGLRAPESFRTWLAMIAVNRVGTHLHRRQTAAARQVDLDELVEMPDAEADLENLTMLRLELSGQRRQVVRASRWLDPDDRALLSLWWLEVAGQLTRTELAAAMGVSVAHAGVRVQRMRGQLELAAHWWPPSTPIRAVPTSPPCWPTGTADPARCGASGLPGTPSRAPICSRPPRAWSPPSGCSSASHCCRYRWRLGPGCSARSHWAGRRSPPRRRHCPERSEPALPASGPVPRRASSRQLVQAVAAHPVVATLVAGAAVGGAAVTTANWPAPVPAAPTVIAAPATAAVPALAPPIATRAAAAPTAAKPAPAPTRTLAIGKASLESVNEAGRFRLNHRHLRLPDARERQQ